MTSVEKAFCGRMCGASCGTLVTIKEEKIIQVKGDPDFPFSKGYLCPKGRAIPEFLNHPSRIKYPLKRIGERGEGKWQKISTDEALNDIVTNIKRISDIFGSEAIVLHRGADRGGLETSFMLRLAKVIGTPNTANVDNVCHAARTLACSYTYGTRAFPDYNEPPKCIIIWGRNSLATGADSFTYLFNPKFTQNTKFVVIDPRNISLTSRATHWIKPRPGSDGILAIGLLKAIIEEGLYDQGFVEKWTIGFNDLTELVNKYSFSTIEEQTWVKATEIKKIARLYSKNKPAIIQNMSTNIYHESYHSESRHTWWRNIVQSNTSKRFIKA